MPQVFVEPNDEIEIVMYVGSLKSNQIVADVDREKLKEVYEDELDEASVEEHKAYFRLPNYLDSTNIIGAAMSLAADGTFQVNPSVVRLKRMALLVKRWDFLDKAQKATVPTEKAIASLHSTVAGILGMALENKLTDLGF